MLALLAAAPAFAQDAAPPAAAAPFTPDRRDGQQGRHGLDARLSSALVLMMSVPALALFYGGLVRTKNMLSVLMQVLTIVCIATLDVGRLGLFAGLHRRQRSSSAASARPS